MGNKPSGASDGASFQQHSALRAGGQGLGCKELLAGPFLQTLGEPEPPRCPRPPRLCWARGPGDGRPGATRVSGRPSRRVEGRTEQEPGRSEKASSVLRPSRARRREEQSQAVGCTQVLQAQPRRCGSGGRLPSSPKAPSPPDIPVRSGRLGGCCPPTPACSDSCVEAWGRGGIWQGTEVPLRLGPLTRHTGRTRGTPTAAPLPRPCSTEATSRRAGPLSPCFLGGGRPKLVALGALGGRGAKRAWRSCLF